MSPPRVDLLREELIVGRRRIPLREIQAVELEPANPDLRLAVLGMLVGGVLGVPALNLLGAEPSLRALTGAAVALSAGLIFWGIYNLIGAGDRYRVWVQLALERKVAMVTGDPDQAAQVVGELRRALVPRPSAVVVHLRPATPTQVHRHP